jgi:hypothetical protein
MQAIKDKCTMRREDPVKPSISLGCAMMRMSQQDINLVLKEAKDMMYLDKLVTGQNRI